MANRKNSICIEIVDGKWVVDNKINGEVKIFSLWHQLMAYIESFLKH
jgi:hypothetical protein